jgi:hypothetical protein
MMEKGIVVYFLRCPIVRRLNYIIEVRGNACCEDGEGLLSMQTCFSQRIFSFEARSSTYQTATTQINSGSTVSI